MKWSLKVPKEEVKKIRVSYFAGIHYLIVYDNREIDIDFYEEAGYAIVEVYNPVTGSLIDNYRFDKVRNVSIDYDIDGLEITIDYN